MKKYVFLVFVVIVAGLNIALIAFPKSITYSISTPYKYMVTPGSGEWERFSSRQEKVESCNIPDKILNEMTTEALVETVLNYPLLADYISYDDHSIYSDIMESEFNGYRELLQRKDINKELLKKYKISQILENKEAKENDDYNSFLEAANIEFLLAHSQIKGNRLTMEEASDFINLLKEKNTARTKSNCYSLNSFEYGRYFENILDRSKLENKYIVYTD